MPARVLKNAWTFLTFTLFVIGFYLVSNVFMALIIVYNVLYVSLRNYPLTHSDTDVTYSFIYLLLCIK